MSLDPPDAASRGASSDHREPDSFLSAIVCNVLRIRQRDVSDASIDDALTHVGQTIGAHRIAVYRFHDSDADGQEEGGKTAGPGHSDSADLVLEWTSSSASRRKTQNRTSRVHARSATSRSSRHRPPADSSQTEEASPAPSRSSGIDRATSDPEDSEPRRTLDQITVQLDRILELKQAPRPPLRNREPSTGSPQSLELTPDAGPREASGPEGSGFSVTLPIGPGMETSKASPWGLMRFEAASRHDPWTRRVVHLLQFFAHQMGRLLADDASGSPAPAHHRISIPEMACRMLGDADRSGLLIGEAAVVSPDGTVLQSSNGLSTIAGWPHTPFDPPGGLLPHIRPLDAQHALQRSLRHGRERRLRVMIRSTEPADLAGSPSPVDLHVMPVYGATDTSREPSAGEPPRRPKESGREDPEGSTENGSVACSLCWFATPSQAPSSATAADVAPHSGEQHTLDLRRRVRAERALVEASQLLVSSDACDFDELLAIVGQATRARYAYLIIITPDDVVGFPREGSFADVTRRPIHLDTYRQHEWFASPKIRESRDVDDDGGPTFAVPILSSDDQLFGYLGVEYETGTAPYRDEDARVLSVLGDMLCTYLQRQLSEEALRKSEKRYRYFVDTIDEAIWRIDLSSPIDGTRPVQEQVEHVIHHGEVSEANAAMARLLGHSSPSEVIGTPMSALMEGIRRDFLIDLVQAGFELRQYEYVVKLDDRPARYFVLNTVGVDEGGGVTGIWGSSTEVTDRVVLERRMVEALERQQQRFGHDLHDRVSQQLAGTRMLAQNLATRYFDDDPGGQRDVEKIIDYVAEAAQHVSDLQRGVMPVQVDRDGLAQGLRELTSRMEKVPGVDAVYEHDGTTDIGNQEVKLQIYRIAQEATRNAITHGNPSAIQVKLHGEADAIVLTVEDDGNGFDIEEMTQKTRKGLGLHSMRYRARAVGATFNIESSAARGTRIEVRVPRARITES